MTGALVLEGVTVAYGGVQAVHGISLRVEPGQVVAVIGPNGAGKSSLLNAAMGVLPAGGEVRLDGSALGRAGVEARVRAGMSLVPERRELFATMTVLDNLRLGAWRLRREGAASARRAMEEVFALFPRLRERAGQRAGTLSGGERQMLAMGRALMARPRVLLLDEPSLGLAPLIVAEIIGIVARLRTQGVAILLVEQNARAALGVADRGYVLETGRVTLEGPAETLAADPRVVATYLGAARDQEPGVESGASGAESAVSANRLNPG
jgi:branched-chain amino acid transport system ATP-binding protein